MNPALFAVLVLVGPSTAVAANVACPYAPNPTYCEHAKCVCDPSVKGDPVNILTGSVFHRTKDVEVSTSLGTLEFFRTYVTRPDTWDYRGHTDSIPVPFGRAGTTVEWMHNWFSFVRAKNKLDVREISVRTPGGAFLEFAEDTDAGWPELDGGWVPRDSLSPGIPDRLRHVDGGYDWYDDFGNRKRYGAVFVDPSADLRNAFFLTSGFTPGGQKQFDVKYASPSVQLADGGTFDCPVGAAGSTAGVPYVSRVETADGVALQFHYIALPIPSSIDGGLSCVVRSVQVVTLDGGSEATVGYAYVLNGGVEAPGRLSGVDGGFKYERYTYSSGEFRATTADDAVVYSLEGPLVTTATSSELAFTLIDDEQGPQLACSDTNRQMRVLVRETSAGIGNGTTGSPGYWERSEFGAMASASRHGAEFFNKTVGCDGGEFSCSPGVSMSVWAPEGGNLSACSAPVIPVAIHSTKDARSSWSITPKTFQQRAGQPMETWEQTSTLIGASTDSGSDPLTSEAYGYSYDTNIVQHRSSVTKASVIQLDAGAGEALTYDSVGRMTSRVQFGYTQNIDGGVEFKRIGTFFRQNANCNGSGDDDPLGRTLRIEGPCDVNEDATGCAAEIFAITTFDYHSPTAAGPKANRLAKVTRYPWGCDAWISLVTRFDDYTALGDPTVIVDQNNDVTTALTYASGTRRVTSRTITPTAGLSDGGVDPVRTWTYGYDGETLSSIESPEGNIELLCYRTGAADDCTGGTLTKLLRWRAKTDSTGVWRERISYSYWPDGTVQSESYELPGSPAEVRMVKRFAVDAQRRPTWSGFGDAGTSTGAVFELPRGFDGADNLVSIGKPFANSPPFCRDPTSGALSYLCAQMQYDRANRISVIDDFPNLTSTDGVRACIDYDSQGNVSRVSQGCGAATSCEGLNAPGTVSTCDTSPNDYLTDDFGNVIKVTAANTGSGGSRGVYRYAYNAMGNVVAKVTPAMTAAGTKYLYSYDHMGRFTAQFIDDGASTSYITLVVWDGLAHYPTGCGTLTNTAGRIASEADMVRNNVSSYDGMGRVVWQANIGGGYGCDSIYLNPATTYTYSPNGNLTAIQYPFGRTVRYNYSSTVALADRVTSISSTTSSSGAWNSTLTTVVSDIQWEPYGGLRSYKPKLRLGADLTVDYLLSSTPTSSCVTDATGRPTGLWVSTSSGAGDVFKRSYEWRGDLVWAMATNYRGDGGTQVEVYGDAGYDGMQRLVSTTVPSYSSTGGWGSANKFFYDSRGNRTRQDVDSLSSHYTNTFDSAPRQDQLVSSVASYDAGTSVIGVTLAYDVDGRVSGRQGLADSTTAPSFSQSFDYGTYWAGSEGTFRSVTINGVSYTYYYDSRNRREVKLYPTGYPDDFYYDNGHQLLDDRGLSSIYPPLTNFTHDEYIWLDGKAIAVWKSYQEAYGARADDALSNDCIRNDVAQPCGLHFLINDYLPKPVLALDWDGRIEGTGEYNPSGQVNSVQLWGETAHPYSVNEAYSLGEFAPPMLGLKMKLRAHFSALDTDPPCHGDDYDSAWLYEGNWGSSPTPITYYYNSVLAGRGAFWTPWTVLTANTTVGAGWYSNSSHEDNYPTCWPNLSTAVHSGTALSAYQYQRYETGATPWFPPIRLPGQYFDEETELHENWNRFYDPATGRYLSPEPLLQSAPFVAMEAEEGRSMPAYAYGTNNPLKNVDGNGLYSWAVQCDHPYAGGKDTLARYWHYPGTTVSDKTGCLDCKEAVKGAKAACAPPVVDPEFCACARKLAADVCTTMGQTEACKEPPAPKTLPSKLPDRPICTL